MIFNQKFIPFLLGCLKNTDYVLFEHFEVHKSLPEIPFNFLLKKENQQSVIDEVQTFSGIGVSNVLKNNTSTELHIAFQDGTKVQLNFWQQLSENGINYLEVEKVLSNRQRSKSEFFMPNLEHLFEFSILYHYLNNQGLSTKYLSYFEDFHFFVKDGLLDFFNEKYKTQFSTLDEFSEFKKEKKTKIIEELKDLPANQFFTKINLQWFNWWAASAAKSRK